MDGLISGLNAQGGGSRVRLCFLSGALVITAALLSVAAARADEPLIVALGASNTYGKGVARRDAFPAHLERLLRARGVMAVVRNAGINGNTTAQMLARLRAAVPARTRVVVLQPGGNDFRRGISRGQYRANIKRIKRRLRARGIRVVMLRNRLIGKVARSHPRPDGQHFKSAGYRALARILLPRVLSALRK
ncbi:MAG: GDSL-type esterase/lipase family protein [Pseudomonadota bacterium]